MPTPNESSPATVSIASPRQTCPPEEERMFDTIADHARSSDRSDTPAESVDSEAPSRTTAPSTVSDVSESLSPHGKERGGGDFVPLRDTPSPMSTIEESSDADLRPVQPAQLTEEDRIPVYPSGIILSPFPKTRFQPNSTSSFLRPGARFTGTQESDRQRYQVRVDLQHVDMNESFLCGYLRIQGLTEDHPTLTTYFEGEIIGPKYTFVTKHPEWGSNEKVDHQHWNRFREWRPLAKAAKNPNFNYKNYAQREHVFMRWKEHFLVPDHRVRTISGASFEGFYYICFNQISGEVKGIYFHARSEKYQQLMLEHVPDGGCTPAFEFT